MRTAKFRLGAAALIVLQGVRPAFGDTRTVAWQQLSPVVVNRHVIVSLLRGARVEGTATGVEPASLIVDVQKSSDPHLFPRGRNTIPRKDVVALDLPHSTRRWRIIGTLAGGAAGLVLGVVVAFERDGVIGPTHGGTPLGIATIAGVTAGGFLIGWAADRHKTTISIAPDAAEVKE